MTTDNDINKAIAGAMGLKIEDKLVEANSRAHPVLAVIPDYLYNPGDRDYMLRWAIERNRDALAYKDGIVEWDTAIIEILARDSKNRYKIALKVYEAIKEG